MRSPWSPQQDRALRDVARWLQARDRPVFRLFGYAGTGKTTLARHLASGVDGTVLFAAYTGKAASVLRSAGCAGAQTLHSLIYNPQGRSTERLRELEKELADVELMIAQEGLEGEAQLPRQLADRHQFLQLAIQREKKNADRPLWALKSDSALLGAALLVVDECSMVDERMAEDILSFQVPVLVLGDPAQLPPVGGEGAFTRGRPDIMLTEIHRQARDNPIVAMATKVREGEALRLGSYGSSAVVERATADMVLRADQLLVGRNRTRVNSNARVRQLMGLAGHPLPTGGEKLICLRNDRETGLLNGTMWRCVGNADDAYGFVDLTIQPDDGGDLLRVTAHREHFVGEGDNLSSWDRLAAQELTWGYAVTTHKAQGSQWPRVVVIDEWFQRDTRQQWLYTAITRAQEQVTVVRS